MNELPPDGFYAGTQKIPSEIVERGDIPTTTGMRLCGQGLLKIMMPSGTIGCVTFRGTSKEDFLNVMNSIADIIFKNGPFPTEIE